MGCSNSSGWALVQPLFSPGSQSPRAGRADRQVVGTISHWNPSAVSTFEPNNAPMKSSSFTIPAPTTAAAAMTHKARIPRHPQSIDFCSRLFVFPRASFLIKLLFPVPRGFGQGLLIVEGGCSSDRPLILKSLDSRTDPAMVGEPAGHGHLRPASGGTGHRLWVMGSGHHSVRVVLVDVPSRVPSHCRRMAPS